MRNVLLILLLPLAASGKEQIPFSRLHADSVVIYDYEGHEGNMDIIEKGKLNRTVKKQHALSDKETQELSLKLNQRSSYGGGTAACFDPHLGVVYYKGDSAIAHVSICLECNRLSSSIEIREQQQGKQGSGKDVYYVLDGMSKRFRKQIDQLIRKYKFSHPIPKGSVFD